MRQKKRQNASPRRVADSHAGTKTIDTMSTRTGSIVMRVTSTAATLAGDVLHLLERRRDQPRQTEDQVQRLRSTELHTLHPVVKGWGFETQEVDRSCDLQNVLLDVTLYHLAEDFLTFPLHCVDE